MKTIDDAVRSTMRDVQRSLATCQTFTWTEQEVEYGQLAKEWIESKLTRLENKPSACKRKKGKTSSFCLFLFFFLAYPFTTSSSFCSSVEGCGFGGLVCVPGEVSEASGVLRTSTGLESPQDERESCHLRSVQLTANSPKLQSIVHTRLRSRRVPT